jgi:UDP-glucose 4-epimerase
MQVLVTGVAGFLGSHIAEDLLARGHQVIGIDNLIGGYRENIPEGVGFHQVDLLDFEKIAPLFRDIELVVHAACTAYEGLSVFSPHFITQNTFGITSSVMSASCKSSVRKIIYFSSMSRYGTQKIVPFTENLIPKPQDPYGIAKLASEALIQNVSETHGLQYSILVPHNIIGSRQKFNDPYRNVASIMINRMLQGKQPIIYGDGEQKRSFSFIKDVINPFRLVCETDIADNLIVNIGPDEEFVTINELAQKIANILSFDLNPIYFPDRPQEVKNANCSANLARKLLNYETKTSLNDGLIDLINFITKYGPKNFEYVLPLEFTTNQTPETWTKKLI